MMTWMAYPTVPSTVISISESIAHAANPPTASPPTASPPTAASFSVRLPLETRNAPLHRGVLRVGVAVAPDSVILASRMARMRLRTASVELVPKLGDTEALSFATRAVRSAFRAGTSAKTPSELTKSADAVIKMPKIRFSNII